MKLTISLCLALSRVKLSYRQFLHSFYSWRALATCAALCTVCACAADSPFSGIAEVAVRIGEAAQPDGFYRDILGFDRLPNDASGNARYQVNHGQLIEVVLGSGDGGAHRVAHFSLATADIRSARAFLERRGVQTTEIVPGADGNLRSTLRDPDGYQVVITQVVADSLTDRPRGKMLTARRLSTRLRHVGIQVADLDIAAAFYHDKLGLAVEQLERGKLRWVDMRLPGGDYIQMQTARESTTGTRRWALEHFGLDVSDAHATYQTLLRRGVPANARFEPVVGYAGHLKINFADPDGTHIELMELGDPKATDRRER